MPTAFQGRDWGKLRSEAHGLRASPHGEALVGARAGSAQTAIADVLTHPETWDPETEPLLKNLAKRVISLASNEWNRKRTALEVLFLPEEGERGATDKEHSTKRRSRTCSIGAASPLASGRGSTSPSPATRTPPSSSRRWPEGRDLRRSRSRRGRTADRARARRAKAHFRHAQGRRGANGRDPRGGRRGRAHG